MRKQCVWWSNSSPTLSKNNKRSNCSWFWFAKWKKCALDKSKVWRLCLRESKEIAKNKSDIAKSILTGLFSETKIFCPTFSTNKLWRWEKRANFWSMLLEEEKRSRKHSWCVRSKNQNISQRLTSKCRECSANKPTFRGLLSSTAATLHHPKALRRPWEIGLPRLEESITDGPPKHQSTTILKAYKAIKQKNTL